jgi:hypothetical protein
MHNHRFSVKKNVVEVLFSKNQIDNMVFFEICLDYKNNSDT